MSGREIWKWAHDYVQSFGCDALSYLHLPPPGAVDFDDLNFFAFGFSEDEITSIESARALSCYPFKRRTLKLYEPIFWTNAQKSLDLSEAEWNALRLFYTDLQQNGLIIPVHGAKGRDGCIILRFKDNLRVYSRSEVRRLQFGVQFAHQEFCKKCAIADSKLVVLTSREREILTWVARGKSNSVIADIIGISQHTVNGYLRRIYLKTRTSDRTTASVRGIGEALIDY